MRNNNCQVLSGADTGSVNGSQVDANQIISASFQIVFGDASAAGTFLLQGSNDIAPARNMTAIDGFVVTNWTAIPSQTTSITGGASALLTIANSTYRWLRAVYTSASGGSTTVVVNMNALSM